MYDVKLRDHNLKAHKVIAEEIADKKSGLFNCVLRIHDGMIVDVVIFESYGQANRRK